jgi:hypothetical protein
MINRLERKIYADCWRSQRRLLRNSAYEQEKEARKDHRIIEILLALFFFCLLFIFWPSKAHAEDINMVAIAQIESGNDSMAENDSSGARGLCQLMPSVLEDFNEHFNKNYTPAQLFDGQINLMIADWYMNHRIPSMLKHFKIPDNIENRLIAYNFGIGNLKKHRPLPEETKSYIVKYENLTSK